MATAMTDDEKTAQHYYKNSLLLEADIEEEMQSLTEEIERKRKTMADILDLPKKISHECMVPLSKVAFTPGRMVHTNEFSVQVDSKTGAREWMSHVEAADYLRSETERIAGDVSQLKNYLATRRGESVSDDTVKRGEKVGAVEATQQSTVSTSTAVAKAKEKDNKEEEKEYVPFAEEIVGGHIAEEDEDDEEEGEEEEGDAGGKGFEIREYCDKDGNILDGQVVDLSAELTQVQSEQQQQQQQQMMMMKQGGVDEGGDEKAKVEGLVSEINDKLSASEKEADIDQDSQFIRDLAEISTKKKKNKLISGSEGKAEGSLDMDSLFASLEKEEEEAEVSRAAANQGLLGGSTWKKGFFGGGGKKKVVKKKRTGGEADGSVQSKSAVLPAGARDMMDMMDTTERNTLLNKTMAVSNGSSGASDSDDRQRNNGSDRDSASKSSKGSKSIKATVVESATPGEPSSLPMAPPPKRVSRFKQNRAVSTSSSSSLQHDSSSSSAEVLSSAPLPQAPPTVRTVGHSGGGK